IRHVVEARDVDRDVVATDLWHMPAPERPHAAVPAEEMMGVPRAELVVREVPLPGQQPKRIGLDDRAPGALLAADRAVASARPGAEIDVRLEADGPAVTAPGMDLAHRWLPIDVCRGGP